MSELGHLSPTDFPPPKSSLERTYLDAITDPAAWKALPDDIPAELFAVSEIANPHSRMKKQRRWQARLELEEALRTRMVREEMQELRGRKRAVARREAIFRWKGRVGEEKSERVQAAWLKRGGLEQQEKNTAQLERKAKRKERRLREVVLPVGERNQFIPQTTESPAHP
jgi:hypothetical protein